MNFAQARSENTYASFSVQPSRMVATVLRFDYELVPGLIGPPGASSDPRILGRIRQIEEQIAKREHLKLVEQATLASAESLASGWDNPLDAEYDDL